MSTKKTKEPAATSQICVRMAANLIERIDAYRDELQAGMPPSFEVSRPDAVRALVTMALDHLEKPKRRK